MNLREREVYVHEFRIECWKRYILFWMVCWKRFQFFMTKKKKILKNHWKFNLATTCLQPGVLNYWKCSVMAWRLPIFPSIEYVDLLYPVVKSFLGLISVNSFFFFGVLFLVSTSQLPLFSETLLRIFQWQYHRNIWKFLGVFHANISTCAFAKY